MTNLDTVCECDHTWEEHQKEEYEGGAPKGGCLHKEDDNNLCPCEQFIKTKKKRSNPSPKTIEKIYELVFGDDAIHRDFSESDLIDTLKEFTEKSHAFEVMQTALQEETSFDINKGVSE